MRNEILSAALSSAMLLALAFVSVSAQDEGTGNCETYDLDEATTTWNLTPLFPDKDAAKAELQRLEMISEEINETYRPQFDKLTGTALLRYTEDEKNFSKNLDVLQAYTQAQTSLNVNDEFFESLISDLQNLSASHYRASSFVEIKLKTLTGAEWEEIFGQEPGLDTYRQFYEDSYIRYADHRPMNESHAAFLADLGNQLMKLETEANKKVTNNVTKAGNITLSNGETFFINSQSYYELLSTDPDRDNRKKCYDKRLYHLIGEADTMAEIYVKKAMLDDDLFRELSYKDAYDAKMFRSYLKEDQIEEMNSVFKERKGVFDGYYEFRREKMDLEKLMPYDLHFQLTKDPGKEYSYTDSLTEIQASYAGMDPSFNEILTKIVTGGFVDVYPNPEGGKEPGGYCMNLCAVGLPSLIFLNYKGLISDKITITHEMGHAINIYLMGSNVDYLYCGGAQYELEVPSTFNEELLMDWVVQNYDKETAVALLANHIGRYQNYFSLQPQISEFEREAHRLCEAKEDVTGADLNALLTSLDKEYRSGKVGYYDEDEATWTYISHIYFPSNYYTFNYALSRAITLSLFKKYKENPEEFNKSYIAYLSAGTTMTPPEKLRKYFGIEMNRELFEDAMDMVEIRVKQLEELENKGPG